MVWLILFALFLVILLKVWPKGLWFVLAAAVLLAGGVLYWQKRLDAELERVVLAVQYVPEACPQDTPLRVSFHNVSDKPVYRVLFTVHARIPGYSTVVTPYTYKQFASEKILQPGEHYSGCYPVPLLSRSSTENLTLDALEWFAEVNEIGTR